MLYQWIISLPMMLCFFWSIFWLVRWYGDRSDPRVAAELELAVSCFDDPAAVRDGYYAHTCRKCASAFGPLGFPEVEEELNWRADEYYAGN